MSITVSEIRGADPCPATNLVDNSDSDSLFARISRDGRWAVCGRPELYAGCPSQVQQTPLKTKAKKQHRRRADGKLETIWTTAVRPDTGQPINLAQCMSGSELVAAFANGAFPMPLRQRVKLQLPSEDQQRRMTGAKWKLRGTRLAICGAIAYAMVVCKREALVITFGELARALELSDPSWIADLVYDLRVWGLVAQDGTWVQHGVARSRRGSVLRLTDVGAHVFRLDQELDTSALPTPEDLSPRPPKGKAPRPEIYARGSSPDHPDITPDVVTPSQESANHVGSLDRSGGCSVSTSSTSDCRTAVPDESVSLPSQERVNGRPVALPGGSLSREVAAASRRLGDVVPAVRRGDVEYRRVDPETHSYPPGVVERARKRERNLERERANARARQQADIVKRRQSERGELVEPVPPPIDPDPWAQVAEAAAAEQSQRAIDEYKRQLERDREEFANVPRPKHVTDDDRDLLEVLEASCRLRGMQLPVALRAELSTKKGGAS